MNKSLLLLIGLLSVVACQLGRIADTEPAPVPTSTIQVAKFVTAEPSPTPSPSPDLSYLLSPTPTVEATEPSEPTTTDTAQPEATVPPELTSTPEPLPTATKPPIVAEPTVAPPTENPPPAPAPPESGSSDFILRLVKMRTNQENSWDGVLNEVCGSDHSIYVYVADAQENLLDGVLVGDRYGNFEVPTGVDGPGMVRVMVWSATMELAVMGHQDGTRYSSEFTIPLSTLDEDISLDWLQQSGYCESPDDCRQRVETNQLCRGHYSYDVIFQRSW